MYNVPAGMLKRKLNVKDENKIVPAEIYSTGKCPNCINDVKANDEFCTNCGARLK